MHFKPIPFTFAIVIGLGLWFAPVPAGLSLQAWRMFSIFAGTLTGIMGNCLPLGAVALLGLATTAITGVLSPGNQTDAVVLSLSGFGEPIVWLIVAAFMVARGLVSSGLGLRVAYYFVRAFGKSTLGLAYALIGADAILAPAIPSNTARGGGLIYPVTLSLVEAFDSRPQDGTERKIGSYLLFAAFHGNMITSLLFLTAMAANPMATGLAAEEGIEIGFTTWLMAASVPGIVALVAVPLYLYRAYPPKIRRTPEATEWATRKLRELGPMDRSEWWMATTFVLLLTLWVAGDALDVHPTTAALIGLGLLLLTGVLRWEDIIAETGAWDVLIWFSVLLMMARFLGEFGFTKWLGSLLGDALGSIPWFAAFVILIVSYSVIHYFFASQTAQVAALYGTFLAVGLSLEVPGMLMALSLAFASNYYATTTIYGGSVAPIYFQSGYIKLNEWMIHGAIILAIHLLIFLTLGVAWFKLIGMF